MYLHKHAVDRLASIIVSYNAFKIISATERPVLTTRKGKIPEDIRKIVMPLDITVDSRQKVPITAELAELFGAEVHIITVTSSRGQKISKRLEAYSRQAAGYLTSKKIPFRQKSLFGDHVVDLIVVYADSVNADMITIMKEQSKSLTFISNLTHQLLNRATIPVLTISNKETHIKTGFSAYGG